VFMAGLGLTVLAGWAIHVPALPQFLVRLPPMTCNSAACLLLCGLALLIIVLRGPHWLVILCAGTTRRVKTRLAAGERGDGGPQA
jgi:hypothetical protein